MHRVNPEAAKLEEAFGCEIVVNHTGNNAHHITATALLLPAELTDGSPAVLAEKIVANVLTKEGTGCVLPKTTVFKGELCLKVENNHTVEPTLTASQAIQESCSPSPVLESKEEKTAAEGGIKNKLLFGINETFLDGKASFALSGVHKGLALGVLLIWVRLVAGTAQTSSRGKAEDFRPAHPSGPEMPRS
jgi:hypothetical protein